MACTFFLSYARQDSGAYLDRFIRDLLELLQGRMGCHDQDLLFRDTKGIDLGERWPDEIARALSSCRVFLSLHSPTYFTRTFCGKEWTAFVGRLDQYAAQSGRVVPPLIVPIHWIPLPRWYRPLPQTITSIQRSHANLGEAYATRGLNHLLRLRSAQYQRILDHLAGRLIQLQATYDDLPVATTLPDLSGIESAFAESDEPRTDQHYETRGVRHVQFAVVAGKRDELRAVRSLVEHYGDEAVDWCPYPSAGGKRIGAIAQHVASEGDLTSEFLPVGGSLTEMLARARDANNVVIFLVDPWTLGLPEYRRYVKPYDEQHHHHCALLILWSDDSETHSHREALEIGVRLTFITKTTLKDLNLFRDAVDTPERLHSELRSAILYATSQILKVAELVQRAEAAKVIRKPWIAGPGGL